MMNIPGHRPFYRGSSCVCADCGLFFFDVRTGARLRTLSDVDPVRLAAVERRFSRDPELAKRLVEEDPRKVVSTYKFADKLNDFLDNPKARPDLQTPEAQHFLQILQGYHNPKVDALMPWLAREWKKGRVRPSHGGKIQFDGGPEYEYTDGTGENTSWHNLTESGLDHWADWYKSNHPSRQGKDIMQMKAPEMHQTIKDWDTDMRQKAGEAAQSRGNVEHSYPDGWTVQRLNTQKSLEDEGDSMGHCVGSYWPDVQSGNTMVYSLRDHQNEPHATWEVRPNHTQTPLWPRDIPYEGDEQPIPHKGTMVQVQGKGNEPPVPAYQKRIKDYFEKTIPDVKDRPTWEDQSFDNPEDLAGGGRYGYVNYHPGDYGLRKPHMEFDWDKIINDMSPNWHDKSSVEPKDVIQRAHEEGQLPQFEQATKEWGNAERIDHMATLETEHENQLREEYAQRDPEPNMDGPGLEWEEWADRRDKATKERINQAASSAWPGTPHGQYQNQLETEIAAAKMRAQREQEGQVQAKVSKRISPHTNYSTGLPCYCSFNKVSPEWHESKMPTCEVCGDPLEGGKCKRCDWGGWSNAMGDGDQNPTDPTREFHPSIQASIPPPPQE